MKFGLSSGKQRSGADLSVLIWQAVCLLPLPYLLILSGYPGLMTKNSLLAFVFDCGMAALPRWLTLGLSALYRLAGHELIVYFILPVLALAFGLLMKKLLRGGPKTAKTVRLALCAAVILDLVLRACLPQFRSLFGWPAVLVGVVIRLAMPGLLIGDLIAGKKPRGSAPYVR